MFEWLYKKLMSISIYMDILYSYEWTKNEHMNKLLNDKWEFVKLRDHPGVWLGCMLFSPNKDILWKLKGFIVNRGLFLVRKSNLSFDKEIGVKTKK